jgi:vacuolar-type H+-ATPase subunit H
VSTTDDHVEQGADEPFEGEMPNPYSAPETEALLGQVIEIVEAAPPLPLSSSSRINKDEVLDLLDEALARLPDELRAARWLLKERDEFLAKVRSEGDDILESARSRAEQMVQRTEVVKAAEQRARQIVESAEAEARRMRHETEDFCDQKLASFEIVLQRTHKLVSAGRAKLQAMPLTPHEEHGEGELTTPDEFESPEASGFFDQDLA